VIDDAKIRADMEAHGPLERARALFAYLEINVTGWTDVELMEYAETYHRLERQEDAALRAIRQRPLAEWDAYWRSLPHRRREPWDVP
jgi:hypothetical protein